MSYNKQNFEDNQVLTAEQLNHMEDGIEALSNEVDELRTLSGDINELRDELTLKNTMSEGIDILNIITRKL